MTIIKKIIKAVFGSNRPIHFAYGAVIGALSEDEGTAIALGSLFAGGLELKDDQHGGKFDFIDFAATVAGAWVGYQVKKMVVQWIA